MRNLRLAAILTIALTATAFAMTRPVEIGGAINAAKPYGQGSLSWLFITAYDASLWTDARQWSMNERFALTLVYRMSFTTEELANRTIDEMQSVAPHISVQSLTSYRALLQRAFPAVKAGDRITALHTPGSPVRFFHNGKLTAESADPAFAEPFFAFWLSPKTSERKLRSALLRLPK